MAQHYLHRFGSDDTRSNSTRAGVYLLAAAELGDSNAQQMRLGGGREMVGKWGGWEGTGITWRINGVVLLHHIYIYTYNITARITDIRFGSGNTDNCS